MKPDSNQSSAQIDDEKNRSSTDWTPSIIEDSDLEGRSSSSTLSWTDEADCSITEQLKLRFEQFEAALYSEVSSDLLTPSERAEKEIWNEYTPHLRVTGKKINLISQEFEPDGATRCESPAIEEIITQHPDSSSNYEGKIKVNLIKDERRHSCRSDTKWIREAQLREDPATKERLSQAVAEKLLEQACPNAKKVGLVPKPRKNSARSQPPPLNTESDSSFKENNHLSFSVLSIKEVKRYAQPDISLKPINFQFHSRTCNRAKSSHFDSSGKADVISFKPLNRSNRHLSSARHSRKKLGKQEHETESMSDDPPDSPDLSARHGLLPPIESLSITPKLPNKRANSAMLRFTKTQPRTRPTTSRSKSLFAPPHESFSICNSGSKFTITPIEEDSPSIFGSNLPLSSTRKMNKHIAVPPRWRY